MTSKKNPGCLAFLLGLFGDKRQEALPDSLPYRVRDDLLSAAELSFYHVLSSIVGSRVTICIKVNLADILYVPRTDQNVGYRNRIASKHVDYLLCDPGTMKPFLAIELDDVSHSRPARQARDEFVDKVFQAAGLPLLHIAAQREYSTREIAVQVGPFLRDRIDRILVPAAPSAPQPPAAPLCPKCGVSMVLRTATKGEHQGRQFYGCPNYPRCKEIKGV